MPSEPHPPSSPRASPDGSLLGWLEINYPATHAKIINNPRDLSRSKQYRDSNEHEKHPAQSPKYPTDGKP